MWARCSLIISSRNFPRTFQASDAPEMSRFILGNATNIFKRASSVGEDALSVDTRYEKIRSLGRGSFGFVQLALDKATGEKVAIKFWPRDPSAITKDVQGELRSVAQFNHPHIIGFKRVILTPTHLGLVMEYAAGGDLFRRVSKSKGIQEEEARGVFQQLLLALDYCHGLGVANRDIKLDNVLLTSSKKPAVIKLTDFGFCKQDKSIASSLVGTAMYMAPEITGGSYDAKMADVWSCGIMLYVMLYSNYPFPTPVSRGKLTFPSKPRISEDAQNLMKQMLVGLNARIKMADMCSHPWVTKGLPEGYFLQNKEYHRVTQQLGPAQSLDEIDRLLKDAGLRLACSNTG